MKLFICLALIIMGFKSNSTQNSLGRKDTTLKLLTYGLPIVERVEVMNAVAKKYGFSYYAVAGCMVTQELRDSVDKENKKVIAVLEERFGKNWQADFRNEVNAILIKKKRTRRLLLYPVPG